MTDINHLALPDTLFGEKSRNCRVKCRDVSSMKTQVVKRSQMQQSPFWWKEEEDKSTKWRGSCVSTLIMTVCAITVSTGLIWENVFFLQIDRSRDGENPCYPAKVWRVCWTSPLDKDVPVSHNGKKQHQQQHNVAKPHKKVHVMTKLPLGIKTAFSVCVSGSDGKLKQ